MPEDTQRNDGRFDLVLTRTVDVPRALVWEAWTKPEHIKKWFTPAPWTTVGCEIDLRPGGIFRFVMRSPEGKEFPYESCYLEVAKPEKLIWTRALGPGYRPMSYLPGTVDIPFTCILTLVDRGGKTDYTARVLHKDDADRKKHEEMGFHLGWNQCLDQLVEMVKRLPG
jgi:uncharacterized protein YndB with AHSA1/START domain